MNGGAGADRLDAAARQSRPFGEPSPDAPARIVAIGASAGGLEPIERFFAALPLDTGCAFVVIQHLSPDFRSMMDELLARHTGMRIRRLEDGMTLEPDCIYLNLPRSVVTLHDERLRLDSVPDGTLVSRPIDAFFTSVAEQRAERALAVVLSGTGSDGVGGCERIRERGGTVLVQSPQEARFDSMPRAVIAAGLADSVAPSAELGERALRWARGLSADPAEGAEPDGDDPIADILSLLRSRHGTEFRNYKSATIVRRIRRRADLRGTPDLARYRALLRRDADELDELYGDLLIEVTSFFRDAEAFERLGAKIVPALVDRLRAGESLRLWVAGCASGEEAYSLAILLAEHAEAAGVPLDAKILSTDIHGRSLERAAAGVYPLSSVRHLSAERTEAHFVRDGERVQVRSKLRRMLLLNTHDIVRDTPFTRIDLLSCRNLLIYLNADTQARVLAKFHFALKPGSWLFLGPSESISSGVEREFDTVDRKWRIYRKRRDVKLLTAPRAPVSPDGDSSRTGERGVRDGTGERGSPPARAIPPDERSAAARRAHRTALERIVAEHAPPGFLLTPEGEIVHVFGEAGALLSMRPGLISGRVAELIRPELRAALLAALQTAKAPGFDGFARRVYRRGGEDGAAVSPSGARADADLGTAPTLYDLSLSPIDVDDDGRPFLLLSIAAVEEEAAAADAGRLPTDDAAEPIDADVTAPLLARIRMLEQSLRASEESRRAMIVELETGNEELRSTNEELHSVNQELYTLSAEHQRRIEELSELNSDVDNLLRAAEIGTVFLDRDLRLRRFSERAKGILGLRAKDLGRSLAAIRGDVPLEVAGRLRDVLETGEPQEMDIATEGRQYLLRLLPYLDAEDEPDGALITSIDVTELTETRRELKRVDEEYRAIVEDTSSFIVRWRAADGAITYCNAIYAEIMGATPEALVGRDLRELIPPDERERFFAEIGSIAPNESRYVTVLREKPGGRHVYTVGYSRAIADASGRIVEYQSTGQDLSDEYAYRHALERLVATANDRTLDHRTRLQRILEIGLEYLDLDSAFVSRIDGGDYHVVAVEGAAAARYAPGDVLALEETVCANLPQGNEILAITCLAESALDEHPCHAATGIEAFVGARLTTTEGDFGSVAFSSPTPRETPFTVSEESFILLTSSWIGYLVDSRRQIERITDEVEYHRSLYRSVPVVICLADADGRIVEVSDEWLAHLGGEREDSRDKPFVDLLAGDDRAAAREALARGTADDLSLCVCRADGELVEHEMSCRAHDVGTLRDMRLIVLTDVSERNRAMGEVEGQNRRLAAANENLNQFAFVASHDLQEPLRKIQQFSGFLSEDFGDSLDRDGRYHLKVIVEAAGRMSALIRDLLQYSRTSRNALERERVALGDIVEQVRQDLDLSLAESGGTLEIGPLPEVSGDPMLLLQLFTNLIGNAIKYRSRARALLVRVHAEQSEGRRRIVVEDNGVGFDPLYARKVFEPFTRLHGSKDYRGSGIGLAICTTVCDKHGWRIEADGAVERGSRFTIVIDPPEAETRSRG